MKVGFVGMTNSISSVSFCPFVEGQTIRWGVTDFLCLSNLSNPTLVGVHCASFVSNKSSDDEGVVLVRSGGKELGDSKINM